VSEQEREKLVKSATDEESDDVESHVLHRGANDEGDDGDDVEAHQLKKG
jgi:hypothetical protein